jgi:NH3-dependent NAD+ synthetase
MADPRSEAATRATELIKEARHIAKERSSEIGVQGTQDEAVLLVLAARCLDELTRIRELSELAVS